MAEENTIYSAPDRAPLSAGKMVRDVGLASAAGTAAAAIVMVQMMPDPEAPPQIVSLLEQQQIALAALANVGVTTVIATAMNVIRNWLFVKESVT